MFKERYSSYPSRRHFEHAANKISELIRAGRLHVGADSHIAESVMLVRYLPNRRINLLTIDEIVRCTMQVMNNDIISMDYEKTTEIRNANSENKAGV